MYQRVGAVAYKNNLNNTLALDDFFGHPHKKYKTIHVAGTNGKGSVSHLLAAILQESGYKTGLYTSPHLIDFRERIKINGQMISEDDVVAWVAKSMEIIEKVKPSFFEMTVSMALDYFAASNVDVAVIETGLGGRLDSTNIITPELSVITNIGFDHTNLLGDSLEKIATEKAGIIKQNVPVLIGELQEDVFHVFFNKSKVREATIFVADEIYTVEAKGVVDGCKVIDVYKGSEFYISGLRLPLLGDYQYKNIKTVLKAVDILRDSGFAVGNESVLNGIKNVIKNTGFMGRWQVVCEKPLVVCDTGHNEDGIREVVAQLAKSKYNRLHIVFGVVNDKDLSGILGLLPKEASYYFTQADIPRSLSSDVLRDNGEAFGLLGGAFRSVREAVEEARKSAGDDDLVFIGGSTFVVGEAVLLFSDLGLPNEVARRQ
jgi:dihydrofolate synthase/folylpolyglutamate synthase